MIKPKKIFGQHFLNAPHIVEKIIDAIPSVDEAHVVIEIGPGMGALTKRLLEKFSDRFYAIEIDNTLSDYLLRQYSSLKGRLIRQDILQTDFQKITDKKIIIVGNFPYNISSQIIFKVIENRSRINGLVGMFQKEMAQRIVASPGSKDYGIPSVLTAAYYQRKYLFDVNKACFTPPPKVTSGVIKLERNHVHKLECDESLFFNIVRTAFNQRRKMLRNSLSSLVPDKSVLAQKIFTLRPEQLSVTAFVEITNMLKSFASRDDVKHSG
jgi:16S rRNA (adenine1518-N6/adenine1519-N6)-dimethyltransferase